MGPRLTLVMKKTMVPARYEKTETNCANRSSISRPSLLKVFVPRNVSRICVFCDPRGKQTLVVVAGQHCFYECDDDRRIREAADRVQRRGRSNRAAPGNDHRRRYDIHLLYGEPL